ncbi:MAG: polysaccharide biosynthesis C-terminal domain-containing protein [Spirochaetales bacterium]|nr:polysaccharide biosynthesis C-terminal domain-containing protein [Spirochaetales bacterium]MCF7938769.1 polysaccharide biosynthesis C-terminal domain-containing protein [Spirochaetales bacterium]
MNRRIEALSQAPPGRLLLRLSGPAIVTNLATAIYSLTDAYFVGVLGPQALAAVGIGFPLLSLLGGIGLAAGTGGGSAASRLLGSNRPDEARQVFRKSLAFILPVGTVMAVFLTVLLPLLLPRLGATEEVIRPALSYLRVLLPVSILTAGNMVLTSFIRSEGNTRFVMSVMAGGALLNGVLDPLLIFTAGMGISGAAWATGIAHLLIFLASLVYLGSKKSIFTRWHQPAGQHTGPQRLGKNPRQKQTEQTDSSTENQHRQGKPVDTGLKTILTTGFPAIALQLLFAAAVLVLNRQVRPFGEEALAAAAVTIRILSVGIFISLAICQAYQPIAGFSIGANNRERLRRLTRAALIFTTIFCTAYTFLIVIPAPRLAVLFSAGSGSAVYFEGLLRYSLFAFPAFGFQGLTAYLALSAGKPVPAAAVILTRLGLFLIPLLLILPEIYGFRGIELSLLGSDLLSVGVAVPFYRKISGSNLV